MKLTLCILLITALGSVEPHGHMLIPLARTSIFKDPSYGTSPPYFYDNHGIYCGNIHQDLQYSRCGRCGEVAGNSDMSQGGKFDKGVPTGNYTAGSIIDIVSEFSAPHKGFVEFQLCNSEVETDSCFQTLVIVSGSEQVRIDNKICVPYGNGNKNIRVTAQVQLPIWYRCSRCTLRWNYRTAYGKYEGDPSKMNVVGILTNDGIFNELHNLSSKFLSLKQILPCLAM